MQSISAKEQRGRLRADQRIVGYGRFSPVQSVFSVDQTQWGTEPIEHEQVEMSIGRADTSGRLLYWGDVIQCRVRPTGGPSYLAILGPMERPNILADLKTGELWTLDQRISDGLLTSSTWVDEMGSWSLPPKVLAQLTDLVPSDRPMPKLVVLWALLFLTGGLSISAFVQLWLTGEAGPVLSTLGGSLSLASYWWLSQRRSAWMTRKHLVTLTWQIALTLATVGVMYGVLFDDVISIRRSIVYMMVGLFLGGTVTTITGDMLSWIRGGYASELPKGKWNRRYPNR